MKTKQNHKTDDPYAKNRRSMWFGAKKKQRQIPWSKLWLPTAIIVLLIVVWAIREPKEETPGSRIDTKASSSKR